MLTCAEMKHELFLLFSPYGEILEINIKKAYKMKGQAFIVFKEIVLAEEAMKRMQGFNIFGKDISIQYAKTRSDAVAKKEGTFDPIAKKRMKKKEGKQGAEEEKMKEVIEEKKEEAKPEAVTGQSVRSFLYKVGRQCK
jgi:RNA recognition motif-containing protein